MPPHLPSVHPLVRTLAACALTLLTACAAGPESAPRNLGLTPATAAHVAAALDPRDTLVENSVMLSFSGGGARAAAFTLGALQGLDTLPNGEGGTLLDQVRFITSVSGGSMTAAYYGLHGKAGLPEFRRLALLGDSEGTLRTSLFNPRNIWRLLSGGLNDRSTLPTWLEQSVFKGATFAQMSQQGRPVVWINATNLRQRIARQLPQQKPLGQRAEKRDQQRRQRQPHEDAAPVRCAQCQLDGHGGGQCAHTAHGDQPAIERSQSGHGKPIDECLDGAHQTTGDTDADQGARQQQAGDILGQREQQGAKGRD